mgnify:CR=1 FL=1|jgi:hypothetical protein
MTTNDYDVGYKKPPKQGQFKLGQSGNPKGRPKGLQNLSTDLQEELEQKILITEANKSQEVTKQRAMIKTLFAKALKGETRAANVLIGLILGIEQASKNSAEGVSLTEEDQAILAAYTKQLLGDKEPSKQGEKT